MMVLKERGVAVSLGLLGLLLAACGQESLDNGLPDEFDCRTCHGDSRNAAPPADLQGGTETSTLGVGAHQAHLNDGPIRQAIECSACHVPVLRVEQAGHIDELPADVTFSGLAIEADLTPDWDRDQATCSGTYCHGGSLAGGLHTAPVWTTVDGSQRACDSCHGAPPPPPHPASDACADCHPRTVRADGRIDVAAGLHIDGQVEVGGLGCTGCHGGDDGPAPPVDLDGSSDPADLGVGAHQAHLTDGALRQALDCDECHLVPDEVDDVGHTDTDLPAELTWGALATADGTTPAWDRDQATCASTYCHGASLTGGSLTAPVWTTVDGSQAACGTCHGAPPPAPHPPQADCATCHPGTLGADGRIDVAAGQHIDGQVQVAPLGCDQCHGSDSNPAPPVSVAGSSDTGEVGVGAHQAHLVDGALRQAIACDECHLVPGAVDEAGHTDSDLPAELTWGALASADGAAPAWDHDQATCASTYCHGATLDAGGSLTAPAWTTVDGSQAACGTCHGNPPPSPHPLTSNCRGCHPDTVAADGSIDVAGGQHIDGRVDLAAYTCISCHGSADNPAPPVSVSGASETSQIGIGAHQAHLVDSNIRRAIACDECHLVPVDPDDPTHRDGLPAELTWGALALADGAAPAWDRDQETCSNTYCHGTTLDAGGQHTAPVWTLVDGSQATCIACHGAPPPAPHPANADCSQCHAGTVSAGITIDVAGGQHIDGQVQFSLDGLSCDGCHGAPPPSGSHLIHYGATPDDASYGGTGAAADLLPAGGAYAFDCGNCHPLDPARHMNGVLNPGGGAAEIDLSPVGAPAGSLKALNPAGAAYTPGAEIHNEDGSFDYTLGTCSSVYCHSRPTISTPDPIPAPGVDFAFNGYPIVYPPYTVDIQRVYAQVTWGQALTCDGCHGFPPRTVAADVEAGAGDSHSWIDGSGGDNLHAWNMGYDPVACATCHFDTVSEQGTRSRDANGWGVYDPVAIAGHPAHVNGAVDVAFTDELISMSSDHDLTSASWDPAARTCSSVSCHLQEGLVGWGEPYRYMNGIECNQCHQY